MHYLLFYDYVADYLERRTAFRSEHLTLAWQSHNRGELILGGVVETSGPSALLLFKASDISVVENFAQKDPYVR
ncbi:MAG: YciI family protein, partial [Verrucomicrobiota bacterium]